MNNDKFGIMNGRGSQTVQITQEILKLQLTNKNIFIISWLKNAVNMCSLYEIV